MTDRLGRRVAERGLALVVAALLMSAPAPACGQDAGDLPEARDAYLSGEYEEAVHLYEQALDSDGSAVEARRGLARALVALGRYEEAEGITREGLDAAGAPALWTPLGEVLVRRGLLDAADSAFQRAIRESAPDSLRARLKLAELRFRRGARDEALTTFDSFIDVYNRNRSLPAETLVLVGTAVRHLGRTDPDLFQDALRAYDEAVAADPSLLEPRILIGELFLDKYNSAEARPALREVLARNPHHPAALVGLARALDFDNDPEAVEYAERALETDPRYAPAHAFLARVHLEAERYAEALDAARAALEGNPASPEGLGVLAAVHHLRDDDDSFREIRQRADSLYPGDAELLITVAELSSRHRRYEEAVGFASEAVRRDPRNWRAVGHLGLSQLRTGLIDAGRRNLERAFEGDPYNPWFKNTLDLLDTWVEYEVRRTPHFELVLHGDEADVLGPYVEAVAESAYVELSRVYRHEPPTPIRIEVYPDHADFSVRTVGLTGIGALGVSFGPVIAFDSPAARDPASFNWASALWHEIAHSVHTSLSRDRVPRWFSEGLAVHDQRRAQEGWGHGADVAFLRAYDAGRLPPVSRLNDGFMRPEFPGQVVLSYYQSSLVFQFLQEEWDFDAVRRLLRGYGDGATTAELFRRVLDTDPDAFDRRFDAWVRERFEASMRAVSGEPLPRDESGDRERVERAVEQNPDDFGARLRLGSLLREAGELDAAAEHLEHALRLFPEYAGNDGPHWELARVRRDQGRLDEAAEHLTSLRGLNESHLPGVLMEADVRETLGDLEGVVRSLERAIEIAPRDVDVHRRLADVHGRLERWNDAVREREAVVALAPVAIAEPLYRLAVDRLSAGDRDGARRALLRALERAPRYDEALDLLLEIRSDDPPDDATQDPDDGP